MKRPEIPAGEAARLDALRSYGVLDTDPEPAFDALTRLAAHVVGVPVALVSLVDADRQWFKSRYGLEAPETPRDVSFCGHVVGADAALVVADAWADPRFADNPLVTGEPRVRFYVGMPLRTADGHVLGTLCAIDHVAREVTDAQREMLRLLAAQVVDQLELRRRNLALARATVELDKYRRFFDVDIDLLATFDAELFFVEFNPAWQRVVGWTPDELRAVSAAERIHPEDLPATLREAGRMLRESGSTVAFEHRFAHRGGGWVTLSWNATARDGLYFASARDMTAVHAAQAELRASNARSAELAVRLNGIFGSANYSIIETDPEGTIREFNAAAERMLGYRRDEVVGKVTPAVIHDVDEVTRRAQELTTELGVPVAPGFDAFVAKARRDGADEREWTYVRKDGSRFPVELSVTVRRDQAGTIVGYLGIASDISERHRARALLQQSERRTRAIVDGSPDAIVTIDEAGTIQSVNPSVERLLGYARAELVGQNVKVLMPSPHREAHDHYIERFIRTGERKIIGIGREVEAMRRDGSTFPADLTITELHFDGRRNFAGVLRDISDRKRVDLLQSEFVSTVSHELRTPLTSIRGSLGLIAGGITGELPAEAKEYVEIALSNSDRLVRLINDLLDMEKMQSGHMEFRPRATDLASAVRAAIEQNEAFATAHRVRVVLAAPVPAGEVVVDPDRLAQVLTNLISNAAKFSPPDSLVEVTVTRIARRFRIAIRDHGPGIPPEFRDRIFQRFAQADASTTRAKGGTGLGLAISKAIVEKMHGRMGFEPAEGGGTVFFFELPYLAPLDAPPRDAPSAGRVLICEDDPDVGAALERLLASAGYLTHTAPTVERARRLLDRFAYDAITLDLVLADGEATPLIAEVRGSSNNRSAPIIVVSGSSSPLGRAVVWVSDVLAKPFVEARLLAALKTAIATCRSRAPRLLHVEDDADIRRVVKRTLPDAWTIVAAPTAQAARSALAEGAFDVVLLDLSLPDGAGDDLLQLVGRAQVIVFSASDAPEELGRRVAAALVKSKATPADVRDAIVAAVAHAVTNRRGATE